MPVGPLRSDLTQFLAFNAPNAFMNSLKVILSLNICYLKSRESDDLFYSVSEQKRRKAPHAFCPFYQQERSV